MGFIVFRRSSDQHHFNFRTFSPPQKEAALPMSSHPYTLLLPTTDPLSLPVDLPTLGISYTWNPTTCGFQDLAASTEILFQVHSHVTCASPSFLSIGEQYSAVWIDHILYIPSSGDALLGCFYFLVLWIMYMKFHEQVFKGTSGFISSEDALEGTCLGLMATLCWTPWTNLFLPTAAIPHWQPSPWHVIWQMDEWIKSTKEIRNQMSEVLSFWVWKHFILH